MIFDDHVSNTIFQYITCVTDLSIEVVHENTNSSRSTIVGKIESYISSFLKNLEYIILRYFCKILIFYTLSELTGNSIQRTGCSSFSKFE